MAGNREFLKNIPDIQFANNFRNGMPTNLMTTLASTAGTVQNISSSIDDAINAKVNDAQTAVRNTATNVGNFAGKTAGEIMGVGMSLAQEIETIGSAVKLFTDDMLSYTTEVLAYVADYALNFAVTFPSQITSYAAKYSKEEIAKQLKGLAAEVLTKQDVKAKEEDAKEASNKVKDVVNKCKTTTASITKTVNDYVEIGVSYIRALQGQLLRGREWVEEQIDSIEESTKTQVGQLVQEKIENLELYKQSKVEALGTAAGDVLVHATVNTTKKLLKKTNDKANAAKSKVLTKSKVIVKKTLFKLLSKIGG